MLKSKISIYLMLFANIIIWGYFIVSILDTSEPPTAVMPEKQNFEGSSQNKHIHHTLLLNYADPFLKKQSQIASSKKPKENPKKKSLVVNPEKLKPSVEIPDLKYLGVVQNKNTGVTKALVSLNGVSKIININDVVNGYLIRTIQPDKLILSLNGKTITIPIARNDAQI